MFVPLKMDPAGAKRTWEKFSAFLNSFYPDVKQRILRLEWINNKIGRNEVYVLFNQTHTHICVCVCVCVCVRLAWINNKISKSKICVLFNQTYIYSYIYIYIYGGDWSCSEFKLQSGYYIYFQTDILRKLMNSFIPPPIYIYIVCFSFFV